MVRMCYVILFFPAIVFAQSAKEIQINEIDSVDNKFFLTGVDIETGKSAVVISDINNENRKKIHGYECGEIRVLNVTNFTPKFALGAGTVILEIQGKRMKGTADDNIVYLAADL